MLYIHESSDQTRHASTPHAKFAKKKMAASMTHELLNVVYSLNVVHALMEK
jgi:hypothetical protein